MPRRLLAMEQGEDMDDPREVVPLKLVIQPGGMAVKVTRPDTLVGRHAGVDLRLPLADVSRHHCRLVYQERIWEIVDLNSLNGVYVNGTRVERSVLCHRDQVRIGGFIFEVDLAAGQSTVDHPASNDERVLRSIVDVLNREPRRQAS